MAEFSRRRCAPDRGGAECTRREDRLTIRELSSLRRPTEQQIERLNCRGHAAGGWRQRPQTELAGKGCVALRDSPRETLANLSITGHLRCFSDQPVAEIVQCGEPARKAPRINNLKI